MDRLEMLTAREQLMEDIDCIVSELASEFDYNGIEFCHENLTRILCDAVCKNFPTN
jgi:hypothetical protein